MLNIAVQNYHLHSITSRVITCTLRNIKLMFFSDEAVCLGAAACNFVVIVFIETAANEHTIHRARQHNVRQPQTYFYYNEHFDSIIVQNRLQELRKGKLF